MYRYFTLFSAIVPVLAQDAESGGSTRSRTALDPNTEIRRPWDTKTLPEEKRWYHIPLPLIGTSSLPPQVPGQLVDPLSQEQKLTNAIRHTIGPVALLNRALLAGYNQYRNHPEEWGQGWGAYGQRYEYRMVRLATRNAVVLVGDLVMHTDQRYDRCDCSGVLARSVHAFRRVVVARTDSNGETLNAGRIAGAYVSPVIAYRLYPENYYSPQRILQTGSVYLVNRGLSNLVREFWPEIHRIIRIGPRVSSEMKD